MRINCNKCNRPMAFVSLEYYTKQYKPNKNNEYYTCKSCKAQNILSKNKNLINDKNVKK